MIFAQHEWGLALTAQGAGGRDIDKRRDKMMDAAEDIMRELDEMEELWRRFVREELFEAVQGYPDGAQGNAACYRAPDAQGRARAEQICFADRDFVEPDEYLRVARTRYEAHILRYTAEQRATGLVAETNDFRRRLGELIGKVKFELSWSSAGPIAGMSCVQVNEPSDPHTWNDNFLCSPFGYGLRFWHRGVIAGMHCVKLDEPSDPHDWHDNYLCSEEDLGLRWSTAGRIHGMECVKFKEDADPHTWDDNYLCWPRHTEVLPR